jgi:hypothetical protein
LYTLRRRRAPPLYAARRSSGQAISLLSDAAFTPSHCHITFHAIAYWLMLQLPLPFSLTLIFRHAADIIAITFGRRRIFAEFRWYFLSSPFSFRRRHCFLSDIFFCRLPPLFFASDIFGSASPPFLSLSSFAPAFIFITPFSSLPISSIFFIDDSIIAEFRFSFTIFLHFHICFLSFFIRQLLSPAAFAG